MIGRLSLSVTLTGQWSYKMPRGPKREKRTADTIMITKIASGEIDKSVLLTADGKNAAAVILGRMGGQARAKAMTAKRRKEIAKTAAAERWWKK